MHLAEQHLHGIGLLPPERCSSIAVLRRVLITKLRRHMDMKRPLTQLPVTEVESLIVTVREQRVILAPDLAAVYDVPTKALNQAVKRNAHKFPTDSVIKSGSPKSVNGGFKSFAFAGFGWEAPPI